MSRKTRTTLGQVEKLIEQRRLFQDWMDKLAAGSVDGMPSHVIERVRNDYRDRLAAVMSELGEHREALEEALSESQEREDALDAQHQEKKDELAELKLRRHVGEMDEARFKEQSGVLQTAIDQIKKDSSVALRDIERYEEILETIASGDAGKEEQQEEEKPVVAAAASGDGRGEATAARPPEPPRTERKSSPDMRAPKGDDVDELAFLRSVTTGGVRAMPPAPAPVPAAAKPAPPPAVPAAAAAAPAPAPAPVPAPVFSAAASATARQKEVEAVHFEAAPGLVHMPPAAPEDEPKPAPAQAQAPKKEEGLACKECGTVNRPTEWYCEKCGAELAAF